MKKTRLTSDISHEKTWTWLRKGNLKRETESLLIAVQTKTIRTYHIKVRISSRQQNSRCRLCGDRGETINHIISKLAQKEYKTWYEWVGKVIHWELCQKLKFDQTNKCYMYNPESVMKNETQPPWNFDIHTNESPNLGQTTRPYNNQQKGKNLQDCGLCCSSRPQSKF